MSEKLVKVLEEKGKAIVTRASEQMEDDKTRALREMNNEIKNMVEALKAQPLKGAADVVELLERGSIVKVATVDVEWDHAPVTIAVGNRSLIPYEYTSVDKGAYRVTLIIEPLEASA